MSVIQRGALKTNCMYIELGASLLLLGSELNLMKRVGDLTHEILFNERGTLNSSTIELLLKATAVWLLQAVFPGNIRLQISYVAFSFKTLKH